VLTVGLRRMRRDRQRLNDMRERERETESAEAWNVDYGRFEG